MCHFSINGYIKYTIYGRACIYQVKSVRVLQINVTSHRSIVCTSKWMEADYLQYRILKNKSWIYRTYDDAHMEFSVIRMQYIELNNFCISTKIFY